MGAGCGVLLERMMLSKYSYCCPTEGLTAFCLKRLAVLLAAEISGDYSTELVSY